MKFNCLLLYSFLLFAPFMCLAQQDAATIIQDAAQLNKSGQFADAAAKYAEALKLVPDDASANYGMGVALFSQGKGDDAIPYLQKVASGGSSLSAPADDLLGGIYDKNHNTAKAIEAYSAGIKADPANHQLYFNLGLVYFRSKNYAEAEKCAIQSIKLDPRNAGSQRMYALVCFHQDKRANALLGLCSFILLQPNGSQVTEAYGNVQHILQGGKLKADPATTTPVADANTKALNDAVSKGVADAEKEKHASAADLLAAQLKGIFNAIGPIADSRTGDDFFKKFYADYFQQLAQTTNIPAFARLISQSTSESADWIKNNSAAMQALQDWAKTTERGF